MSREKLKKAALPKLPTSFPLYFAPKACAQSSIKIRLCFWQISITLLISAGKPNVCCTTTTLLFDVILRSKSSTSILKSLSLQSTYTGCNPAHMTGLGTALHVNACSKTSLPFSKPKDSKIAKNADRPLLNAHACCTPKRAANFCSSSCGALPFFHLSG